ncbi:MAG: GNAT family N-acetyltransferase [Clostridia bacterium]|nr:GNAT family N-acetyltransferase [Clostridia bacterium]
MPSCGWTNGYRRQGLGSMLIRAAENAAREKNCYYLCFGK